MSKSKNPYWLSEPCPDWCRTRHRKHDHGTDRDHMSKWAKTLTFTLMAPRRQDLGEQLYLTKPSAELCVVQGHREVEPHITVSTQTENGIEYFKLTVNEALRLAALLATAADVAEGHAGGSR